MASMTILVVSTSKPVSAQSFSRENAHLGIAWAKNFLEGGEQVIAIDGNARSLDFLRSEAEGCRVSYAASRLISPITTRWSASATVWRKTP
jgi:hypothetical protein